MFVPTRSRAMTTRTDSSSAAAELLMATANIGTIRGDYA